MSKSNIEIRKAVYSDIPTIQDMANEIWPIAYGTILSKLQLTYMLDLFYRNDVLEERMFHGEAFIVAEADNKAVGYASFSEKGNSVYKLNKLYVMPNNQNVGAGKAMLKEVIKRVLELGGKEVQLQVNRKNSAVAFYEKMGFVVIREEDFSIGNGFFMKDFIMSLQLRG